MATSDLGPRTSDLGPRTSGRARCQVRSEFYNAQFIPNGDSLAERPTTFHHPAGGVQLATPGRDRSGVADRSSPHFRSESQEFTGKKDGSLR